jgi:DNA-binding beta-propeller fold protein YncE
MVSFFSKNVLPNGPRSPIRTATCTASHTPLPLYASSNRCSIYLHLLTSSPLLKLFQIANSDGYLYSIAAAAAALRWRVRLPLASATQVGVTVSGSAVYAAAASPGRLLAFSTNGGTAWVQPQGYATGPLDYRSAIPVVGPDGERLLVFLTVRENGFLYRKIGVEASRGRILSVSFFAATEDRKTRMRVARQRHQRLSVLTGLNLELTLSSTSGSRCIYTDLPT